MSDVTIIKEGDILYRFEDAAPISGRPPSFIIDQYVVLRLTPRMAIIKLTIGAWCSLTERRMLLGARRPFAFKDKKDAAVSYAHRKFRHIEHARRSFKKAQCLFDNIKKEYNIDLEEPPDEWFKINRLFEDY